MNKIVELLIDWDNEEFDDLGVEIMSLVEKPAIQVEWQAFSEQELPKFNLEEAQQRVLDLASTPEFGTFCDPEEVIYLDTSKEEFADAGEIGAAIEAVDRLDNVADSVFGTIKYRYAGRLRPNSRNFCRTMIGLNKIYSPEEIVALGVVMQGIAPSLYPGGTRLDVIFESGQFTTIVEGGVGQWMGGSNCYHYWQKVREYPNGVVEILGRADGQMGKSMQERFSQFSFSDDDQMIITGPAMIPNQKILRQDEMGNPFHVFFSEDTIKKIAAKFLEDNNAHNTDINHDDQVTTENTLLESWIVADPEMDKSKVMGFDVPKNTWMVSYKINNEETWQKIKNGELRGYSVTGSFIEKLVK